MLLSCYRKRMSGLENAVVGLQRGGVLLNLDLLRLVVGDVVANVLAERQVHFAYLSD